MNKILLAIAVVLFTNCSNNEALVKQNELLKQQIDLQKQRDSLQVENENLRAENETSHPSKILLKKKRPMIENYVDINSQAYKDSVAAATYSVEASTPETDIEGVWIVKLTCSESNCLDVTEGDTKTEVWSIINEGNRMIANTLSGGKLPSQYQGYMSSENLSLQGKEGDIFKGFDKYQMSMHLNKSGKLKGTRHVDTKAQCTLDYTFLAERDQ